MRQLRRHLLDSGADPSARYRDRNTALHTAAFFGRAEAAARLQGTREELFAVVGDYEL